MNTDVALPLLAPLAAWPVARVVAARLRPQAASWLLTLTALALAAGSTGALLVETFAGVSLIPLVADAGHWSVPALRGMDAVNVPLAIVSGVALLAITVALVRATLAYLRWTRELREELDAHSPDGGVILLPGAEPVAFAVPGRGGRIAVSAGMLAALDPRERCALLAHERAHLRGRHHLFLGAVTLATVLNPLLRPLVTEARFALERWADETAAGRVGDRTLVATAVAKAALAGRRTGAFTLAASGGPVPRRVSALLAAPSPPSRRLPATLLVLAVLGVAGWSTQTAVDAAADLHDGIEVAQAAEPGHHAVHGKWAHCQATLAAVPQHHRKCAQR